MKNLLATIFMTGMALPALADTAVTGAVNALRAGEGAPAVQYSDVLEVAARQHADDMAQRGFFDHAGSNGSSVGDRVTAQGYRWCFVAENIAQGQADLAQAMQTWTTSQGHYQNMVHEDAREIGLARGAGDLWVMVLASGC